MGCHTWFYAHIPEKQKEYQVKLHTNLTKFVNTNIKLLERATDKMLNEMLADEIEYAKSYIHECNNLPDDIEYSEEEQKEMDNNLEICHKLVDSKISAKDVQKYYLDKYNTQSKILSELTNPEDTEQFAKWVKENKKALTTNFGITFSYIDGVDVDIHIDYNTGKIYFTTAAIYDSKANEFVHPFFEESMEDIIRIYDYNAPNCNTLDEFLQVCKDHNVEVDDGKMNKLVNWFNKYPDTIVEFG